MPSRKYKTGLFFGSFNPIHNGHLIIANHIANDYNFQEVWFILSPKNPFKEKKTLLNEHHRLAMVKIAIEDNFKFRASDIEFNLSQPSYTSKTLGYLIDKYPNKEFSLIMGADNFKTIHKWFNYEFILENFEIYIYPRIDNNIEIIPTTENIIITQAPKIEISSSLIRERIANKLDIKYLLPDRVIKYIEEMFFYKRD